MVFKPFKQLSIRKPTIPAQPRDEVETEDSHGPPPKRQRLQAGDEEENSSGNLTDAILPAKAEKTVSASTYRTPLHQVENGCTPSKTREDEGQADKPANSGAVDDRYFNVLWRKPTARKHKTWDGDGILCLRAGYAYLQDISGKDMGRAACEVRLEPGSSLTVAGKEVEVDSEIPRQEYLSGRRFLDPKDNNVSTSPVVKKETGLVMVKRTTSIQSASSTYSVGASQSHGKKTPTTTGLPSMLKKAVGISASYKKPLLDLTPMPQTEPGQPTPRHDPNSPGALVMKRPSSAPKGKRIVDVVVDPLLAKHLRQHQREGVQFLYECVMGMRSFNGEGAILADDMGLGKTLQTITLLWTLLKQNPIYDDPPVIKKALIVCPVTLINNWRKEFRKWLGNERIGVFVFDDKRKRLTDFTKGRAYNIMVVGYEKLRTVQEGLARGNGVDIIIADEGHRLKTLQNKSGLAIQSLNATKRVILSGTPIQNDLKEFFAAVDLVNPGVLGTFKAFIREFEGPIVRSRQPDATRKEIEKGEARNEELRNLTSMFILRRTADILAKYLPPKTEYVLFCDPTPTQANIYRQVLASPVFQSAIGSSESGLQLITILKKLCNSPSLLSPKTQDDSSNDTTSALLSSLPPQLSRHFSPSSSAKVRVLDQLLHNLRTATDEKIVLVSNYTSTLNLLANLLTSLSLPFLRLDGSTPAQKRQSLVDDFNRLPASACFAFLLSAKAGGTGLNLIGASRLILFDVDWNPATDIQAMARIHRDGQKRHCRIYRVLLKGSLEEKIWQRQVTKIGLADSVMEHKDSVAQFSRDELRDLFRLDVESTCQTHELLGCDCAGRGKTASAGKDEHLDDPGISSTSAGELSDSSDGSIEDLPDLPTLMKASQVDMDEQERRIKARAGRRRGRRDAGSSSSAKKRRKNKKDQMQQSLSQYSHIDPSLISHPIDGDGVALEIDDDDVLLPLLKEEDCRVKFIFKKSASRADVAMTSHLP